MTAHPARAWGALPAGLTGRRVVRRAGTRGSPSRTAGLRPRRCADCRTPGCRPSIAQHRGQVQKVPGHEGGVAAGELVLRPARSRVEVGRSGAGFADPTGIGLGRDDVADVLQAVEDVHGAVLDAVLVAGDQAPADPAVVPPLAVVVEVAGGGVQPLDAPLGDRAVVAEPDGPGDHEDVRGPDPRLDGRPFVDLPPVLGHVGPHPGGHVVVDQADDLGGDSVLLHDLRRRIDQRLGVGHLRRLLERAVDEQRAKPVEVGRPAKGWVSSHQPIVWLRVRPCYGSNLGRRRRGEPSGVETVERDSGSGPGRVGGDRDGILEVVDVDE